MTKKQRRTFDAEFKLQVVQMIRQQGLSVGEVCRDMKLGETAVRRWLAQVGEEAAGRPGLGKPLTPEQQRIQDMLAKGEKLPVDFTNRVIYYVGPVDPVRDEVAGQASKAMADQIMAADKARLKGQLGTLDKTDMAALEEAIHVHLGLAH